MVSQLVGVGSKNGWLLSTALSGGGVDGEMTTGWKTGSGWLKDLDNSIASSLLKRSNHFYCLLPLFKDL